MRLRSTIAALVLALAGCGSSQARTTDPGRARCGPSTARTLAANGAARIYQRGQTVYGCAVRTGTPHRLGAAARSIREGRAGPVALAGVVAAYGFTSYGVDTITASVVVTRLTDGKQLRSEPATTKPVGAEFAQSVDSVVVRSDGAVAWIAEAGSVIHGGTSDIEVVKVDRHGRTLLDTDLGVDVRSLRLSGSRLTWRDSGQTRSAALS